MAYNNGDSLQNLIELFHEDFKSFKSEVYQDFKAFRVEHREDKQHLEQIIETQNRALLEHTEELIKLTHTVYGNGNKGLIDRLDALERNQTLFTERFNKIETQEKVRAAVLGAICALCSSIGGIVAYFISIYVSMSK